MKGPSKLCIDRIACDGRGLCAELLPELIRLDDWGYPIIDGEVVRTTLEELARDSVDRARSWLSGLCELQRRDPPKGERRCNRIDWIEVRAEGPTGVARGLLRSTDRPLTR